VRYSSAVQQFVLLCDVQQCVTADRSVVRRRAVRYSRSYCCVMYSSAVQQIVLLCDVQKCGTAVRSVV
jgi:hypothetical protein